MIEPTSFTAGDTVKWSRQFADYPASAGWSLSYVAINAAGKFTASGVANGDVFDVTISAAQSADIAPGKYYWEAFASKAGERFRAAFGPVEVRPNIVAAGMTAHDARSHARKVLDAIEAVIEGRASQDQQEYAIGNRSLKRTPIADLIALADRYRAMVAREDVAAGAADGRKPRNKLFVRF